MVHRSRSSSLKYCAMVLGLLLQSHCHIRTLAFFNCACRRPMTMMRMSTINSIRVAVIGGGASGYFSAIQAAQAAKDQNIPAQINIFEAGQKTLSKVKISGGGRCNVLHDQTKPVKEIVEGYPRGKYELLGPYTGTWGPRETAKWFESHGVKLKTEPDGRMFPVTDSSQTVIDCLQKAAKDLQVTLHTRSRVKDIIALHDQEEDEGPSFEIEFSDGRRTRAQRVVLATGSARAGHQWAAALGHTLAPCVPSLFTFDLEGQRETEGGRGKFSGLAGVSNQDVTIKFISVGSTLDQDKKEMENKASNDDESLSSPKNKDKKTKRGGNKKKSNLEQRGPVLITHTGLSGPAALKLSAFAAPELAAAGYAGALALNWLGGAAEARAAGPRLEACRRERASKAVATACPFEEAGVSRRLWRALVEAAGIDENQRWADVSNAQLEALKNELVDCRVQMIGKGTFKDEFVTCGGISLKEVDMKTMQSKIQPGLYFCGEILNIDGITGGYNFQNAWTTGYVAGTSLFDDCFHY